MQKSIYLINPDESGPSFHGAEIIEAWGLGGRTAHVTDLSTTTVAALVPTNWDVSICDERLDPVDFDHGADVVGITGKVSQVSRMLELAREFRQRGKLVIIGGPYASLNPDDIRPHADIVVVGELEEIAPRLFSDLADGTWDDFYDGGRPDLKSSPIPRWDLYPKGRALAAQVQTSRGCPFECEFCDVIQYLGRKQRWKDSDQIIRELEVLYARGARSVFFADDNFTVMRRRVREFLENLADWNSCRPAGRMLFSTQVSIDLARDPELMNLCAKANLRWAFVGIETPNEESLAETAKRQNLRIDLAEETKKIVRSGIMVTGGMIVGFDHDGPDIFERQLQFINRIPVPIISFGLLVAPAATPLHDRMAREGRLINHDRLGAGSFLETNIRPLLMSEAELKQGARWLLNRIFDPTAYAERVSHFAEECGAIVNRGGQAMITAFDQALAGRLSRLGTGERQLAELMGRIAQTRPELVVQLRYALFYYCQARHLLSYYGVWDPKLAKQELSSAA